MAGYIGHKPKITNYTVDEFTTSAAQASSGNFTLSQTVADSKTLEVSVGGIDQPQSAYSVTGTTLAFGASIIAQNDIVIARHAGESISYPSLEDGAVTEAKIGTNAVTDGKIIGMAATKLTGSVDIARLPSTVVNSNVDLTTLSATNLTSGTVGSARLGTGTASSTTVLYGDSTYKAEPVTDTTSIKNDISLLALQTAINGNLSAYGLKNSWIEQFENSTYIENLSTSSRNTTTEYMSSVVTTPGSTQTLIPQATGTPITADTGSGVMTTGGALSKAFDGTLYESAGVGVQSQPSSCTGWIGKDWGAGVTKTVDGFKHYSSTNDGTHGNGANTSGCSIFLYGGSTNVVSAATELGSLTSLNFRQHSTEYSKLTGIDVSTAYRYHWIKLLTTNSCAHYMFSSEIRFYNTPDTVTVNAAGSFNSTDVIPQDAVNKSLVGLVVLYKDAQSSSTTLNTHLIAKVRANTGQAYQTLVLAGAGTYSDGLKIAIAPAIAVTAGQALSYEISFATQSASLETRVHGIAMTY